MSASCLDSNVSGHRKGGVVVLLVLLFGFRESASGAVPSPGEGQSIEANGKVVCCLLFGGSEFLFLSMESRGRWLGNTTADLSTNENQGISLRPVVKQRY